MELVVATNNKGKMHEIRALLPDIRLWTLEELGFREDIPEPYETFEENAFTKADTIYRKFGKMVMADDSGICIDALEGKPGVMSARFAGIPSDDDRNIDKVLSLMVGVTDRRAYYKAVICLVTAAVKPYYFEGFCSGTITCERMGSGGFGYDPVFMPDGYDVTFAQLSPDIKNRLSHRGKAVEKMAAFLRSDIAGLQPGL